MKVLKLEKKKGSLSFVDMRQVASIHYSSPNFLSKVTVHDRLIRIILNSTFSLYYFMLVPFSQRKKKTLKHFQNIY